MTLDLFLQHLMNGISLGGTYALIAIGYTMVYGVLRLIKKSVEGRIRPISIILGGSFGRGEESFLESQYGVRPLRDMDIFLIVKRRWPSDTIKSINKEVNCKISQPYNENDYRFEKFTITLQQIPMNELIFSNDAKTYDIKYASEVVFGEEVRNKIREKKVQIY